MQNWIRFLFEGFHLPKLQIYNVKMMRDKSKDNSYKTYTFFVENRNNFRKKKFLGEIIRAAIMVAAGALENV